MLKLGIKVATLAVLSLALLTSCGLKDTIILPYALINEINNTETSSNTTNTGSNVDEIQAEAN